MTIRWAIVVLFYFYHHSLSVIFNVYSFSFIFIALVLGDFLLIIQVLKVKLNKTEKFK